MMEIISFFFAAMFYVYIIYSEKFDRYYIGHTNDPYRRLVEHNTTDEIKFTTKFRPWEMVLSYEVSDNRGEAIKMERFIKKQKNRQFLKRLIESKDDIAYFGRLMKRVLG
jgi:putative endonuclease